MNLYGRTKLEVLCAASSMALFSTAFAQVEGEASAGRPGLEEVVVTAQKRQERLQDVPISVSALGADDIAQLNAVDLAGVSSAFPGVHIGTFGNQQFSAVFNIRGVGVVEPDAFAGNSVSIVVDGVPQFFNYGAVVDLFDVERIEVLRGPQGTLFGANTTGGVVNIVTRQPGQEFGGQFGASYGKLAEEYDRTTVSGAVDLPITDNLSARISGFHHEREGWIKNVEDLDNNLGLQDKTILRGAFRYEHGDNFDATLIAEYDRVRGGGSYVANGASPGDPDVPPGQVPIPGPEFIFVPAGTNPPWSSRVSQPLSVCPADTGQNCSVPDEAVAAYDHTLPNLSQLNNYRAVFTMNIGDTFLGDITSITGYKYYDWTDYIDTDGNVLNIARGRNSSFGSQWTQEVRTDVDFSDSVNLIAGVYFIDDHYETARQGQFGGGGFLEQTSQNQDNSSQSVFANLYWDLTDQWQLILGGRYSHEKTSMDAAVLDSLNTSGEDVQPFCGSHCDDYDQTRPPDNIDIGGIEPVHGSDSWDDTAWKFGINYKPAGDALTYASYSRGFKSGGFTGRIGTPSDIGPYSPEYVDTYEVGVKTEWLDGRLRTNAALFYSDYKDIQLATSYIFLDDTGTYRNGTTIQNAAAATIKGAELEIVAAPTEQLTLGVSATYLDATYDKFENIVAELGDQDPSTPIIDPFVVDMSGVTLMNAPEWSYTVYGELRLPTSAGAMTLHADYAYTDEKFQNIIPLTRSRLEPTNLINANVDWEPTDGQWSVSLWVHNLADKRYFSSAFSQNNFGGIYQFADPREIGVTLRVDF